METPNILLKTDATEKIFDLHTVQVQKILKY